MIRILIKKFLISFFIVFFYVINYSNMLEAQNLLDQKHVKIRAIVNPVMQISVSSDRLFLHKAGQGLLFSKTCVVLNIISNSNLIITLKSLKPYGNICNSKNHCLKTFYALIPANSYINIDDPRWIDGSSLNQFKETIYRPGFYKKCLYVKALEDNAPCNKKNYTNTLIINLKNPEKGALVNAKIIIWYK